jgi:hypothetical protein
LFAGVAAGFLAGWILAAFSARQYGVVLERLPTKIWWGGWEIAFSAATLAIYALWWRIAPPRSRGTFALHTFMAVLAGTNLLYHFPPLFAIISQLAAGSDTAGNVIDAAEFRRLMLQAEVMSTTIHFWGAAFVVTGVWVMACASRRSDSGDGVNPEQPVVRWGARLALLATLIQLPVGVWVLVELPTVTQQQLMGQDWLGAAMLAGSIILAIALLHHLAAAAFGTPSRKSIVWSLVLMLAIVLLMTGTLHRIRDYGVGSAGTTLRRGQLVLEQLDLWSGEVSIHRNKFGGIENRGECSQFRLVVITADMKSAA